MTRKMVPCIGKLQYCYRRISILNASVDAVLKQLGSNIDNTEPDFSPGSFSSRAFEVVYHISFRISLNP